SHTIHRLDAASRPGPRTPRSALRGAMATIFLELLMRGCLSGVIPRARTRARGRGGGGIGGLAREQARPARPGAGVAVAVAVSESPGGVGAGGVALADQVVAGMGGCGGAAAGARPLR